MRLWGIFYDLLDSNRRIIQGEPNPINHIELRAYIENTGELMLPGETRAIMRMSVAWANAMGDELKYARAIAEEQAKRDAAANG